MESYIGAVFVDSEFDYKQVERFFERQIRWFFEDMSVYDTFANNHPTVSRSSSDLSSRPRTNVFHVDSPSQPSHKYRWL